jgi:hypothetical protein
MDHDYGTDFVIRLLDHSPMFHYRDWFHVTTNLPTENISGMASFFDEMVGRKLLLTTAHRSLPILWRLLVCQTGHSLTRIHQRGKTEAPRKDRKRESSVQGRDAGRTKGRAESP